MFFQQALLISVLLFGVLGQSIAKNFHDTDGMMIKLGHKEREAGILYVPNSLSEGTKSPALLVLHGAYGSARWIENALKMNSIAEKEGLIVAYINGFKGFFGARMWNAGECCGASKRKGIDDIGYISSVIDDLIQNHNVDSKKVYLMGHSNGAMMAYHFVCKKPEKIAAVVAVSGQMLGKIGCESDTTGLEILHIHGKNDLRVPANGGEGKKSGTGINFRSMEETGREISKKGGSFTSLLLDAGHKLSEIDKALEKRDNLNLSEVIANFIRGKSRN